MEDKIKKINSFCRSQLQCDKCYELFGINIEDREECPAYILTDYYNELFFIKETENKINQIYEEIVKKQQLMNCDRVKEI